MSHDRWASRFSKIFELVVILATCMGMFSLLENRLLDVTGNFVISRLVTDPILDICHHPSVSHLSWLNALPPVLPFLKLT